MNRSMVAFLVFFVAFANAQWQSGSSDFRELRNAATDVLDGASDLVHGSERVRVDPAVIGACVAGGVGLLLLIACCACCCFCCRRSATAPQTIVMTPPPAYAHL